MPPTLRPARRRPSPRIWRWEPSAFWRTAPHRPPGVWKGSVAASFMQSSNCSAQATQLPALLSSDTPTLPTDVLIAAANVLLAGDKRRVVLGACDDGGYYLLGMRLPYARLFADIAWSSSSVAATTRTRTAELGLDLVELPLWYDIDDATALERLIRENKGHAAPWTRRAVRALGLDTFTHSPCAA